MVVTFYIYKITNKINGKIYIGKSKNPAARFKRHLYVAAHPNTGPNQFQPIHAAIVKYGKENFDLEIIDKCDLEDEIFVKEIYWISYLKTNMARYPNSMGYNLTDGGEGQAGLSPSLETRNKISQANTGENNGMSGRTHSLETKQQMILSQASRKIRRPLTEEEKLAISITMKGKPRPSPIASKIKNEVVQLYASGDYTKKQLSERFGLKYNSVVKIIRTHQ